MAVVATALVACSGAEATVTGATRRAATTTTVPVVGCDALSPADAAAQLLVEAVPDTAVAADDVAAGRVGGIAFVSDQTSAIGAQISALAATDPSSIPLIVASDEEGGTVQRLKGVLGPLPSARDVARTRTPAQARSAARDYARRLAGLGITMVFGPVLDVGTGSAIGSRSFSSDPAVVSRYARAVAAGLADGGVVPVAKHWPGLGRGQTDTHLGADQLPQLADLAASDLQPFLDAIGAEVPAIMVSHATVPGLGPDPVSRSSAALSIELRDAEGFGGLIITDALDMGAAQMPGGQGAAAEASITAGADIALIAGPGSATAAHDRLTQAIAAGRVVPARLHQALTHVMAVKGRRCGSRG